VSEENVMKVIGMETIYIGTEHAGLTGCKVKILAVIRGGAEPVDDPAVDCDVIKDDDGLARAGGVTAADRVEVQPWIEAEQRWSWVTSDPRAADCKCFAHLQTTGRTRP